MAAEMSGLRAGWGWLCPLSSSRNEGRQLGDGGPATQRVEKMLTFQT